MVAKAQTWYGNNTLYKVHVSFLMLITLKGHVTYDYVVDVLLKNSELQKMYWVRYSMSGHIKVDVIWSLSAAGLSYILTQVNHYLLRRPQVCSCSGLKPRPFVHGLLNLVKL